MKYALIALLFIPGLSITLGADDTAYCPPQEIGDHCTCKHGIFYEIRGTKVVCRDITDTEVLYKEIQKFRGYKIDYMMLLFLQLPYLPAGLFSGVSVRIIAIKDSLLEKLYLSTDYSPSPFDGLGDSLEELSIYSTRDPSKWYWPLDVKNFKKLKSIEIVQSPVNFVAHEFSAIGGGSLESLTIAYSKVYRIHPQAFPELTNLKEVDFRGNFLPYMVRTMFPNPAPKLRKIDLADNVLFNLPEDMFENMPALEFLDLSQNQFKTYQDVVIAPVYNNLRFFYISTNPFVCGCDLLPLKKRLFSDSRPENDLNDVKCERPGSPKLTHLKDLEAKDFNCS